MSIQSLKSEKKLHKEDRLAIFKPGLWCTVFSDVANNGTIIVVLLSAGINGE